jgi:uncharacterized membrane protein
MNGSVGITVLRLIHILSGAFWVGAIVFMAGFLMPALRAVGPAGGPVMQQLAQVRRFPIYMMAAVILTVLSGIALYWRDSNGFSGPWIHSGPGRVFGLGGVLAIIAAAIGMAVASPTAKRMGALAASIHNAGRPPSPDQVAQMQQLQSRMISATRLVAALVVLAVSAMAVARYTP